MVNTPYSSLVNLGVTDTHIYDMIDNYIYFYHMDMYIVLPAYSDMVSDSVSISYPSQTPLGRTAPIYSYEHSGPRQVQASFKFHRDMMTQINYGNTSVERFRKDLNDDYIDFMIRALQSAVLPNYDGKTKTINPPVVSMRMGNDVYIKGVVPSNIGLSYHAPILRNGKYAYVEFSITIDEIDPYDAETVLKYGSMRGLNTTLDISEYSYTNLPIVDDDPSAVGNPNSGIIVTSGVGVPALNVPTLNGGKKNPDTGR